MCPNGNRTMSDNSQFINEIGSLREPSASQLTVLIIVRKSASDQICERDSRIFDAHTGREKPLRTRVGTGGAAGL